MSGPLPPDSLTAAMQFSIGLARERQKGDDYEGRLAALEELKEYFEMARSAGYLVCLRILGPAWNSRLKIENIQYWTDLSEGGITYHPSGDPILVCHPKPSEEPLQGNGIACSVHPVRGFIGMNPFVDGKVVTEPLYFTLSEIEEIECAAPAA